MKTSLNQIEQQIVLEDIFQELFEIFLSTFYAKCANYDSKKIKWLVKKKNIKTLTKNNIYLILIKKNNNYTLFNNKFNIENFNCNLFDIIYEKE